MNTQTPLNFIAAFLAIPTKEYPRDGDGNINWKWGQTFGGMRMIVPWPPSIIWFANKILVITEVVTVAPMLWFWWRYYTRDQKPSPKKSEQRSTDDKESVKKWFRSAAGPQSLKDEPSNSHKGGSPV